MSPGLGVAGFVSLLCFVLYFWSNFLNGTAGWLEVALFATGVVAILMEIFVVPGFGIFGFGGGALIVASLVLASQTFIIPRNSYQMHRLPTSLWMVAAAGAGTLIAMFAMRKFLPDAPFIRRLVLAPLEAEELDEQQARESLTDYDYLLHKSGQTITPLKPSGKARFGDAIVNVMSDGDIIAPNTPIAVIEVRGNVVVVSTISHTS